MELGAQGKWIILQKAFSTWPVALPCAFGEVHVQLSGSSRVNSLRAWWGCRWLSGFSPFAPENVASTSSSPGENKSSASNDYPASGVTAPSHALARPLCFRVYARVWHLLLELYHVTLPDVLQASAAYWETVTPTTCVWGWRSLGSLPAINPKQSH